MVVVNIYVKTGIWTFSVFMEYQRTYCVQDSLIHYCNTGGNSFIKDIYDYGGKSP